MAGHLLRLPLSYVLNNRQVTLVASIVEASTSHSPRVPITVEPFTVEVIEVDGDLGAPIRCRLLLWVQTLDPIPPSAAVHREVLAERLAHSRDHFGAACDNGKRST